MKKTVFAIKIRSSNRVADIVGLLKILLAIALLFAAIGGLQVYFCEEDSVKACLVQSAASHDSSRFKSRP